LDRSLRVALLSYRAHPEVGGQGVYVRQLSRALARIGHDVTVFAGQPYPALDDGVGFVAVPSLDLYRPEDPFRRPRRSEFRGPVDVLEYAVMCTGAFPEPLTFSLRAARELSRRAGSFDVVHDNQSLGYGLLLAARRLPLVATVHHPITIDRRLALADAATPAERLSKKRWYSFVGMQARVARRLPHLIAVSESSRADVVREFGVADDAVSVVPNGVDADLYRPLPEIRKVPGKVVAIASSDQPSKGLDLLVEAVAKLRTEHEVTLTIIGKGGTTGVVRRAVERLGIQDHVSTPGRLEVLDVVRHLNEASVAVVPSLYEGFSLPAVEAMACGAPLVATAGGALPEVVGDAAVLVEPGDVGELAGGIATVLASPSLARQLGERGRGRVLEHYTWDAAARATTAVYEKALRTC
jgi:glycosyltransferase involved in cell wall biosynthesis